MGLMTRSENRSDVNHPNRRYTSLESFNLDGVEIARRKPVKRRGLPWKQVLFFLAAVIAFKVFLFLDMGGTAYGAKMQELAQGNTAERVAAWAMGPDPVTNWLLDGIRFGRW